MATTVDCFACKSSFASVKDFSIHFRVMHTHQNFQSYSCLHRHCLRDFKTFTTLKKHLHKCFQLNSCAPNVANVELAAIADPHENVIDANVKLSPEPPLNPYTLSSLDLKKSLAEAELKFIANLYADPLMNKAQIQRIVESGMDHLTSGFVGILKEKVFSLLSNEQRSAEDLVELNAMFEILSKPFDGLDSGYRRLEAIKETPFFIHPVPYILGSEYVTKRVKGVTDLVHREVYGQHVPLKELLQKIFEIPGALDSTLANLDNLLQSDEPFVNIVQGTMWKNLVINQFANKTVLPLCLHFDDFEPDNLNGSHAGDHKLGSLYMSIPCLPSQSLSTLASIYQFDLFLSENKVFKNFKLFGPTIDDLINLETNGIVVNGKLLYFCLCSLIGDNLGIHEILGFAMGFTANFICRMCKLFKDVMKRQVKLDRSLLRTVETYEADVSAADVSRTGVREECVFSRIPSYHPIERPWVDVFHDFAEGGCQYGMYFVLRHLIITKEFLSIETLNFRIQNFDYQSVECGNKIPEISRDSLSPNSKTRQLRLSGCEMLCLVRYLALMIGDYVPADDPVWHYYLVLREIVCIVFAPFVVRKQMPYLSALITEHHELYLSLFDDTLKFKHHVWLHYPDVMLSCGPVVFFSSLLLERHHRPSKQAARATNSRVNLPFTVAMKEQQKLCMRLLSQKPLVPLPLYGPTTCFVNIRELEHFDRFCRLLPFALFADGIISVPWVTLLGTKYEKQMVVAVNYGDDSLPVFASIVHILIEPEKSVQFVLKTFRTLGYNEHLASYEVSQSDDDWLYSSQKEFLTHSPMNVRTGPRDGSLYVTLRYQLPF